MRAAIIILILALSNFIYQYFTGKEWGIALERSCFQGVAILIYIVSIRSRWMQ